MTDSLDPRIESRIDGRLAAKAKKGRPSDGFDGNKTVNEVLDRKAVMTLYGMIRDGTLDHVNGAVKAGKESVVFWGAGGDGRDVALKVYLVSSSNFKNRAPYLEGDPRFTRIKKGTRNLVDLWARKEFRNLEQCRDAGLPVPEPIACSGCVLAEGFVGQGGRPAPTLLESEAGRQEYDEAVGLIRAMYRDARLVHGDFSEYNVFKTGAGLVLFDLGSAVDVEHPRAGEFLKRDINNVTRFFVRRGLTVENPEDVYRSVVK